MIAARTQYEDKRRKVDQAVSKAKFENLYHGAKSIRKDMIASIPTGREASPPGVPPTQHKPGFEKRAILFSVDKQREEALIGFVFSRVGLVMATHEHGLIEDERQYPERPTAGPALERSASRFAKDWRASIG